MVTWCFRKVVANPSFDWWVSDFIIIIDSAPSLGVYYFLSLTLSVSPPACLSVCLSVCHKLQIESFFASRWNRAIFGRHFSMTPSTKRCSSIFDLGPQHPKFTPQNLHKIAYKSACMTDRPDMFRPTRGFRGWTIQWNHAKCKNVVRPTLVAMAATFGLGAESSRLPACYYYYY